MTAPRKCHGVEVAEMRRFEDAQRESRLRSCEDKKRFADEHACRAAGVRNMANGSQQLYIYQCKHCRGWHLTRREQAPYFAADYLLRRGYQ